VSPALEPVVNAMLIGSDKANRKLLHDVFRALGWRLLEAVTPRAALTRLRKDPVHVVIANLDTLEWKDLLRDLQQVTPSPLLVVTSRVADDYLWAEVLNMGGYDVLAQPFDRNEVERVMASARRHFDVKPARAALAAAAALVA
jgi:DNA-binding response OmpR family regulator